jgi:hypothetical protein
MLFVAATLKLYVVPAVNPATLKEVLIYATPYTCHTPFPLSQSISYPVTTDPPSLTGEVHENVT